MESNITVQDAKTLTGFNLLKKKLLGDGVGAVLARGASGSFIVMVAGTAIAFAVNVLLARIMGVSQYGLYIYVLAWINILALFCRLGFPVSLLRFVPAYATNSEWALLRGIIGSSMKYVILASISGLTIVSFIVWLIYDYIGDEYATTFWIGLLLLPIIALTELRQAGLRSFKHVVLAELPGSILRPGLLALATYIVYLYVESGLSAQQVMFCNLIVSVIAFYIGTILLLRVLPEELRHVQSKYDHKEWWRVAMPLFLMSVISVILHQTDIIMIGMLLDSDQAGLYAVASKIGTLATFGMMAANAIVVPMISELYSGKRHHELQRLITLSARGIFAFTLVVSLSLFAIGDFALSIFGEEFVAGYLPLTVLLVGQLFNAFAGSSGFLMTMTGHQNQAAKILGVSTVINVILNAVLISMMGIIGAAIATAITMAIWNISMFIYVWRNLSINPTIFAALKTIETSR